MRPWIPVRNISLVEGKRMENETYLSLHTIIPASFIPSFTRTFSEIMFRAVQSARASNELHTIPNASDLAYREFSTTIMGGLEEKGGMAHNSHYGEQRGRCVRGQATSVLPVLTHLHQRQCAFIPQC